MVEAIDLFNKNIIGVYTLDDDEEKLESNYALYIAKKKGSPKDDFPGCSLSSNVKKTNYDRFSLCCFSSCFIIPRQEVAAPALQ
jgi:hypothetical protein